MNEGAVPQEAKAVLQRWFGDHEPDEERRRGWFRSSPAQDEALALRFGDTVRAAVAGELDDWAETVEGRLALVVVLDQFARNIHRHDPRQFDGDAKATALARDAIDQGLDERLPFYHRMFLYMPLMHAEDRSAQELGVSMFRRLRDACRARGDDAHAEAADGFLHFSEQHAQVVRRFDRFPDRNKQLGRTTTMEEKAWLASEAPELGWPEPQDDDTGRAGGD